MNTLLFSEVIAIRRKDIKYIIFEAAKEAVELKWAPNTFIVKVQLLSFMHQPTQKHLQIY